MGPWGMLLMHLPQIAVAEHSYADLGFLHTKNKGFLRKDVNMLIFNLIVQRNNSDIYLMVTYFSFRIH